jgi:NAD(P)H-dependent flavin oxidoreductase YrpB (nitropropane dioxygenase family)
MKQEGAQSHGKQQTPGRWQTPNGQIICGGGVEMEWKTRITDLLGCKYPIMEGGLSGIGTWELAAAVSETGADGCITANLYRTPEKLRDAIRKMRDATDKPFAINIPIGMTPRIDEMLEVCFEEKIPHIETAGYKPDEYAERIKKSGITWIHKGATVDFCKHAEKLGADAVVLVGLDGYGFKNIKQLPTFTSIANAARQIKVPLLAAGGIADGRTFLGALALGADGIYMGTAFEVTQECRLSQKMKQNIVEAVPDHPGLIHELLAPPDMEAYMAVRAAKDTMPFEKWIPAMEAVHLKHSKWKEVRPMWEMAESLVEGKDQDTDMIGERIKGPYSFSCAYIDEIPTCKQLVERIVREAEEILDGWEFLKTR